MPTRIFCGAGCAPATFATSATTAMTRILEAIDPLLGVDPLLQIVRGDATRLRSVPGIVGFLRLAQHVVDDAEIDERLGRIAAERFELAELGLVERECGAVHRQPALLIGGGRLLGGGDRFLRRTDRAG